ncbi:MAG TPA: DUF1698 domain-containing protein [Candidatus Dormibacteraeota bacterium]|jgi:tRNA (mo5U34)-methyltransferase|nr:DUF1698 domain-containing protein [Candidatus Dormibacteraeota bacterium]
MTWRRQKREAPSVENHPWFHSIDLGGGRMTAGVKSAARLQEELDRLELPDLRNRTVLDVGAWDGWFSFAAERGGARRVVALDEYAWAVDHRAHREYIEASARRRRRPRPPEEVPAIWRPGELPGRIGFDHARATLESHVEPVVGDFMTMDLAPLGRFDVVFFLGVLYHLKDPFLALRRLCEVTGGVAVIETACVVVPGREHHPLWEFFEGAELDGDPSNWWAPNAAGLLAACRAAGFSRVQPRATPAVDDPPNPGYEWHYGRAVIHAWR